MESAVTELEAMFQKAESNLRYLSLKLEYELQNASENNTTKVNPQTLFSQIQSIKTEHARLHAEYEEMQRLQQETMEAFKTKLLLATDTMYSLLDKTGLSANEPSTATDAVERLLELDLHDNTRGPTDTDASPPLTSHPLTTPSLSTDASRGCVLPQGRERTQYGDVTEVEFMSVSSHVRLHSKLSEVNRIYSRLWQHFKDEYNTETLTRKVMYSMGMKVTGATGDAILKVLKTLKLINLSKNGDVTMD